MSSSAISSRYWSCSVMDSGAWDRVSAVWRFFPGMWWMCICSDPYDGGSEGLGAAGCLAACSSEGEREVCDLFQSRSDDPRYNLRTFHRPR